MRRGNRKRPDLSEEVNGRVAALPRTVYSLRVPRSLRPVKES